MDKPCPATFCTEPLPDWSDAVNHVGSTEFFLALLPVGLVLLGWGLLILWERFIKRPSGSR